jgi:hypothetical protein
MAQVIADGAGGRELDNGRALLIAMDACKRCEEEVRIQSVERGRLMDWAARKRSQLLARREQLSSSMTPHQTSAMAPMFWPVRCGTSTTTVTELLHGGPGMLRTVGEYFQVERHLHSLNQMISEMQQW